MEGHCEMDCPVRDPDCPPAKQLGQVCTQDLDCDFTSGAVCLSDKSGNTTCQQTCQSAADCPDHGTCDQLSSTVSICHAAPPKPGGCDVGTSPAGGSTGITLLVLAGIALAARRRATIRSR
jgi:MYXO-CTERM domain-containing protein